MAVGRRRSGVPDRVCVADPRACLLADWKNVCRAVVYASWLLFAVDYLARLILADRRGHYASRHIPDLVVIALPILRPLRLLRLVMLLRILNRQATASLRGRVAVYVAGATGLVIVCAALAVVDAERGQPRSNISTFGDALWWSLTTITTVGYGDRYPVTGQGRLVAVALMLAGIALLGVVTASIASWLIERVREVERECRSMKSRMYTTKRGGESQLGLRKQTPRPRPGGTWQTFAPRSTPARRTSCGAGRSANPVDPTFGAD
jgi:voltage-gated potassium channel